jgi:NAD(P) transhydrogenase
VQSAYTRPLRVVVYFRGLLRIEAAPSASPDMDKYDIIVIGSGPAGQRAAIQAAKFGKKAALVEKMEVIGGAAINTGTIPSKTMREAVLHLSGFYYQSIYGVNYRVKEQITMADLSFRAQHVIKTEIDVTRAQLSRNGIEVLNGLASFTGPNGLRVSGGRGQADYQAEKVIIATGTKPASSPLVPFNNRNIINSDQILQMPQIPKTMIVVGGGVIGVEYTCMFATLGVRVTLIEKRPRLLEFADSEMVEALCYHLRDRRVTLRLNEEVESVEETPDNGVVANLKSKKKVAGEALLYAIGRQGNVDELNLGAAGLDADSRGRILVDADYRTKQPHIFAVGDVIGFPSLGSVSMEQGRIAAASAFGIPIHSDPAHYPYGIYTIPEISFIGKTEEQLTDAGVAYEVGIAYFREIARGQIRGDTTGRLKLIFTPDTKELLGVHIIGEGASELLHIGQAVFALKGTVEYFVDTVFNYPTLAECYKTAAFNGLNKLTKM